MCLGNCEKPGKTLGVRQRIVRGLAREMKGRGGMRKEVESLEESRAKRQGAENVGRI